MNQSIHEANKKRIKQQKIIGLAIAVVGLASVIYALVIKPGSASALMPLGIILMLAGAVIFLIYLRKGIAYDRMVKEQDERPKTEAEKLAEQKAREVEAEGLQTGTEDVEYQRKSHVGLGILGALLGCLLGGLAWTYVMGQGYIVSLCGVLLILLTFGGYKLFSLNRGTEGMTVSVVLNVLMIPVITYCGYIWFFYNSYIPGFRKLSFIQMWQVTWGLLGEYGVMGDFFKTMFSSYIFIFVSALVVTRIIRQFKSLSNQQF